MSHDNVLNVRDPGGPFIEAFQAAYYDPFERETGIRIQRREGGQEPTAIIRDQVERADYAWDVVFCSQSANIAATMGQCALAEHGVDTPGTAALPARYRSAHFLGDDLYTSVFAYRGQTFDDRPAPASWADFWDARRFPGRRSLRNFPMDVMEAALLADGVPGAELYPLDERRAFAKLSQIRPGIDHWWTQGSEQIGLLTDHAYVCSLSNLRAVHAMRTCPDVVIGWHQNVRTCQGWGILQGTPRADLAREFLRFVVDPARQATMGGLVAVSPAIPQASAALSAERQAVMPDGHLDTAIDYDPHYWAHQQGPPDRRDASLVHRPPPVTPRASTIPAPPRPRRGNDPGATWRGNEPGTTRRALRARRQGL